MNDFEPNSLVKECIEKKDIPALRSSICTIIYSDRNFGKGYFKNTLNYVINKCGINRIYEPFKPNSDSIKLKKDGEYSEDDFAEAVYELEKNFCKERIEVVEEIGRSLYGVPDTKETRVNGEARDNGKKFVTQKSSLSTQVKSKKGLEKKIAIGIGIAAVAIGVIWVILDHVKK